MPELPEVETVRTELESKIVGHKINNIFCDWQKLIRNTTLEKLKKEIIGHIIEKVERKGKFLFFRLSGNKTIVFHLRMTGHFIVTSCWNFNGKKLKKDNRIECTDIENNIFTDKKNTFIHFGMTLNKNRHLLLSDVRKFATLDLILDDNLNNYLNKIGPDAINESLTINEFSKKISSRNINIKKVLLDQKTISGIGNIYADEILFDTLISPERLASSLTKVELKKLYLSIKKILKKAIEFGGTTFSDFRNTEGKKGEFGIKTKVYQKLNKDCPKKCGNKIKKIKVGGRGTYFCPECQK